MIPTGHKKGCRCVVCSHKRRVKQNVGYETQMDALKASMRKTRRNSSVPIGDARFERNPPEEVDRHAVKKAPRKKSAVKARVKRAMNPVDHFPRTKRGPKCKEQWFIIDLYQSNGAIIESYYRKQPRAKLATEAASLVSRKVRGHIVRKVELSGPYPRKPTAYTTRK